MPDEALLRRLYLEEQYSIRSIATMLGLATRTVYDALMRYRIPRRAGGGSQPKRTSAPRKVGLLDEATVRHLYLEEGQSLVQIATAAQCAQSSLRQAMIKWNIPRRRRGPR
jgi:transposase-like protein